MKSLMGRDPKRRQLNRQYGFYGLTLLLLALLLMLVKRMYGTP